MGLLAEIQNDALSDTTPVATLLRKVLVLASNMDSNLLEDWVRHELNGYPTDVDVPEYRRIGISFKASGASIAYQFKSMPIAQYVVEKATGIEGIDTFHCRQAIGTIDPSEIAKAEGALRINFDNLTPLIQRELEDGVGLFSFWGDVPASQVLGIIDGVRSRVLDFVLALKKKYPNAGEIDGLTTESAEMERVLTQIYNTTIHGDNAGVIGNNTGATIQITVHHGNRQELRQELARHGVTPTDLDDLEDALEAEPAIGSDKRFGPKVTSWIGRMAGKAASGAWDVSLDVSAALIQAALLGYYGLSA